MGKAPAFQFYAGDRAMELMGLDNEATGAWTRAVMYLWTSGPVPEDRLSMVAGKGWERVRFLFAQFGSGMSLDWMEKMRETQRIFREEAAKNGAKGGRPRKSKKGTLSKSKPNPNPTERVGRKKIGGEDEVEREHEVEIIPVGVSVELHEAIKRWAKYRKEKRSSLTPSGREAFIKKCIGWGELRAIAAIDHSIAQGWTGCYEPTTNTNGAGKRTVEDHTAGVAAATAALIARRRNERERAAANGLHNDQGGATNPDPVPSGQDGREG